MNKLKKELLSDNYTHFFHFFAIFTGIFVVMTIIILQIMRFSVYSTVDSSLISVGQNASNYANRTMARISSFYFDAENNLIQALPELEASKSLGSSTTNMDIILFSANGTILNSFDAFSNYQSFRLDKSQLNNIVTTQLMNFYGQKEKYHTLTVKVHIKNYPAVAYMMAVVNVQQLDTANERYEQIIIMVMIVFWLISILASIYLAKWSRKPIMESYAKQKMFVENASHELRTPLAVLQNRLESLFRKPNETILDNSEHIASSLDEVRNMRILTTNLLNLARRDDGIKPQLVDIDAAFFDTVFENYQLVAEESGKQFISANQINRPLKTDKALLKQLMTILFDNAIKYTDHNGVVEVKVRTTDKHLLISVIDNGPGIKDDDKKKIFDRFYRVDKARTRQKGGFGLGLALAQQIVTSLKGTITVSDNKPTGAIFEVKL
ncbi:HAMP domain-containing sensor histidine kinase [Streptococcus equi subsp. zooepidemicus]|uniref:sensor histidine kinase n=1 Tax=Streptococcus equi TaxID=1336 RepID=UPI00294AD287|nr:HAMP domain-containing sensor histidine kinase [Streptococcus equi]WOK58114.1 HAMP domain-containing sensor histidine kinase [Streptococcus equi subsp. zooepidemicus]